MEKGWNPNMPAPAEEARSLLVEDLTGREGEILARIAQGLSNQEISAELNLSVNTVKWYARQIYGKLGVGNRRQAARRAREWGLINSRESGRSIPKPPTELIGRKGETDEILRLITAPETRLLTLTGLGGIGKSRLAIEVATILSAEKRITFQHGVFFVPLAALANPDGIVLAIGKALGLVLEPGLDSAKEQLLEHLGPRRLLLALDNFEHLLEGVHVVEEILTASPHVRILATSREPLGLQAEWRYELSGLRYPLADPAEDLDSFPAISLFRERARRQDAKLSFGSEDLQSIARICQLVEGMPLAIELAAAWVHTLAPQEIAPAIEGSLGLLRTELRDLPERQRSVRAVFENSWVRMEARERETLANLSVFSGGFSRRAGAEVAGASLPNLASLVRRSLIRRSETDRYEMHELVRQFSREKLEQMGVDQGIHQKHAAFFASYLAAMEPDLRGGGQLAALDQIASDLDNIRQAWDWAVLQHDLDLIHGLLETLYLYSIFRRGRIDAGEMLERARHAVAGDDRMLAAKLLARRAMLYIDIARSKHPRELDRAREDIAGALEVARESADLGEITFCLHALARAEMWLENFSQARSILEQALDICEQTDDEFYQAYIYYRLGLCCTFVGDLKGSIRYSHKSLEISRRAGNRYVAAWALGNIAGNMYGLGRIDGSKAHRREAIQIHEEMHDRQGAAWERAFLSLTICLEGDLETARLGCERAIAEAEEISHPVTLGDALAIQSWILAGSGDFASARDTAEKSLRLTGNSRYGHASFALAYSNCMQGDAQAARKQIADSIRRFHKLGYPSNVLVCLSVVAMILAQEGKFERAAELLGLTMNHPRRPAAWLDQDRLVAELKEELFSGMSQADFRAAWERGVRRDLDHVVTDILRGNS